MTPREVYLMKTHKGHKLTAILSCFSCVNGLFCDPVPPFFSAFSSHSAVLGLPWLFHSPLSRLVGLAAECEHKRPWSVHTFNHNQTEC